MTKVGIITQARMTSTRLPGKVLFSAAGRTMLAHHVDRLRAAGAPIVVATTDGAADEPIVAEAVALGVAVHRGSEQDVLDRYDRAASAAGFDVVVRVTSDCPLIDGGVVRSAIERYLAGEDDRRYVSNTVRRRFPRGFDVEVMSARRLRAASRSAVRPEEREHVTPWIISSQDTVIDHLVRARDDSHYRVTLDTAEDFALIRVLLEEHGAAKLDAEQIVTLLDRHPELVALNAHVEQKQLGE